MKHAISKSLVVGLGCLGLSLAAFAGNDATNSANNNTDNNNQKMQESSQPGTAAAEPMMIKQAQQELKNQGYDPGAADGMLGKNTQNALRDFQRAKKLQVTGSLDQQTVAALGLNKAAGQMGGQAGTSSSGTGY